MTPERMNTMSEALLRIVISFRIKYCPQKPAKIETPIRYRAAKDNYDMLGLIIIPISIDNNRLIKNNKKDRTYNRALGIS